MNTNLLKIVFLTIVGLGIITYVTAPEQPKKVENATKNLTLGILPEYAKVVGKKDTVSKNDIFKNDMQNLVFVVNHDSIAVIKDLKKYADFDDTINPVLVANISAAPWFIKKWVIQSKMEELNQNSGMIMVYDEDGIFKHLLNITNDTKTHFVVFSISSEGLINKVYEGDVKENALDGSMSDEEIKEFIQNLTTQMNLEEIK